MFLAINIFSGTNLSISQLFLLYLFLFLTGSMVGYLIEVLFRRFFSAKKWVNPGFLKGPWLPLYGFGLMIMFTFCWILLAYFPLKEGCYFYNPNGDLFGVNMKWGPNIYDLIPIAIMGLSLIVLEFIAGVIFVKGFKVKLWDYSNMKGNIMGVICPVFDIIWFVVAIIYYYLINPYVYSFADVVTKYVMGFEDGTVRVVSIFFFGVVYGLLLLDFCHSLNVFGKVQQFVRSSGLVTNYNEFVDEQKEKLSLTKKKFKTYLPAIVEDYLEKSKSKPKAGEKAKALLSKIILIDPESKKKAADNYDDNGRPVKDNEENPVD
ncbi:MAG: putative ABC transporter permease [Bacilli bacterium]